VGEQRQPVTAEQIAALRKELANHQIHLLNRIYWQSQPTKIFPEARRQAVPAETRRKPQKPGEPPKPKG